MRVVANRFGARRLVLFTTVFGALVSSGCAALQAPGAAPRLDQTYPVVLTDESHRRDEAIAALQRLERSDKAAAVDAQLQPVTATVMNLPSTGASSMYLPKVGAGATMSDEETRESLRRFIRDSQDLIGSDPAKLSLVEIVTQPSGTSVANYEQRPFRFPIRGNYGKLHITFTSDRKIVDLVSTCIPDAERIQNDLSALTIKIRSRDAVQQLRTQGVSYLDARGNKTTFNVPATVQLTPEELTVYVIPSALKPDVLEFHLAWEIEFTGAQFKLVYVDAVNGEILAVS